MCRSVENEKPSCVFSVFDAAPFMFLSATAADASRVEISLTPHMKKITRHLPSEKDSFLYVNYYSFIIVKQQCLIDSHLYFHKIITIVTNVVKSLLCLIRDVYCYK